MFWKGWKTWQERSRVQADLAVAMVFLNHRREILLVMRDGKFTIPTGHMDLRDKDLIDTLWREAKEELWKNSEKELGDDPLFRITATLGTTPRNLDDSAKTKSFEIFSCKLTPKAAALARYEEKGQKGQIWAKPPTEKDLEDLTIVDGLAQEALKRYAKTFLSRRKGGKNGSAGKNFTQEQELEKSEIS